MRTLNIFIISLLFINVVEGNAQEVYSPYDSIPPYAEAYTPQSVVARMIDGLGYRYHWATKDLRTEDLAFAPGNEGATTMEVLRHIFDLSIGILAVSNQVVVERSPWKDSLDYVALRHRTLIQLKEAAEAFRHSTTPLEEMPIMTTKNDGTIRSIPIWHLINGQISDAIYHTGQIVSYRRSSGNPMAEGVSVFWGSKP